MTGKLLLLVLTVLCSNPNGLIPHQAAASAELAGELFSEEFTSTCIDMQLDRIADKNRFLMLVNKEHALPDGYEPEVRTFENGNREVAKAIYNPLKRMLEDGGKEGLEFVVASAYRGYEYQKRLLDEDIAVLMQQGKSYEEAYDIVTLETMPPGCSEHSTGFAVDLVSSSYQILDAGQETTPETQWLQEHCMEYGFILRYPRGKTKVTGISYESWHYRYVGVKAAREITAKGLTLEEYLEIKMWEPELCLERFSELVRKGWLEQCAGKVLAHMKERAVVRIGKPEKWYRLIAGGIKAAACGKMLGEQLMGIVRDTVSYIRDERPLGRYLVIIQKRKVIEERETVKTRKGIKDVRYGSV